MANRSQIAFIFSVFQLNLFFSQAVPVDRSDQLLILLEQPLLEFLYLLLIHCSKSSLSETILGSSFRGMPNICRMRKPSTGSDYHQCLTIKRGKTLKAESFRRPLPSNLMI